MRRPPRLPLPRRGSPLRTLLNPTVPAMTSHAAGFLIRSAWKALNVTSSIYCSRYRSKGGSSTKSAFMALLYVDCVWFARCWVAVGLRRRHPPGGIGSVWPDYDPDAQIGRASCRERVCQYV